MKASHQIEANQVNSEADLELALKRMQARAESQITEDKSLEQNIIKSIRQADKTSKQINWNSWAALACAVLIMVLTIKLIPSDVTSETKLIALSQLQVIPENEKPEFIVRLEQEIAENKAIAVALNQDLRQQLNQLEQTYINQDNQVFYSRVAQVIQDKDELSLVYCQNSQSFIYQSRAKWEVADWQKLQATHQLVQVVFNHAGHIVALTPLANSANCPV